MTRLLYIKWADSSVPEIVLTNHNLKKMAEMRYCWFRRAMVLLRADEQWSFE